MTTTSCPDDAPVFSITLPARLDYAACEALNDQLTAGMGAPLRLDASEVTFLGGLAAEMLVRTSKAQQNDGHPLDLSNPSTGFSSGLSLLGLTLSDVSCGALQ